MCEKERIFLSRQSLKYVILQRFVPTLIDCCVLPGVLRKSGMWYRIFTTLPLTGFATLVLLSIGSSPVTLQFDASAMQATNDDCYHAIFSLSHAFYPYWIIPFPF